MELRRLRYFAVLAEELHFTRAARRLGIAQPHLSQEIRKLEHELGALLLERTQRRVSLTPAGAALQCDAARILHDVAAAAESVRSVARGETGRIRVGFVGTAGFGAFPAAVRALRAARPGVLLQLVEQTSTRQLQSLVSGAVDVGVMRPGNVAAPSLELMLLRREPMVLAAPTGHPRTRTRAVGLHELRDEAWIVFEHTGGEGLHTLFMRSCAEAGFAPRIEQAAGHLPTMLSLVAAGLGVAMVPAQVTALRLAGVRYLPFRAPVPHSQLIAATRAEERSAIVKHFLRLLQTPSAGS